MTTMTGQVTGAMTGPVTGSAPGPAAGGMSADDLGGLMAAFNEVTARLQASHEALRGEVVRLTRELSDANEQVARSQRLAALGEMAAGIAHEVRNPLGSIRLYASMLEQDLAAVPGPRALAGKIGQAVRTVDAIVTDVLAFAREFRVRREPVEVAALFERVLEACAHEGTPGWKGVRVVREWRGCGPVSADPGLVQQALVNVVRNACEAMADRPGEAHTLTLSAHRCDEPAATVLGVRDTGPGVTPEVVERMFNPFFTTRGTGTGLGLAIVHRIVDAHGGRVEVRNNPPGEGGACVEMVLPDAVGRGEPGDEHGRGVRGTPVLEATR